MQTHFSIEQVTTVSGATVSLVRELLEIWCEKGLRWVQSQPSSNPTLWEQVREQLSEHLCTLWVTGFLQGATRKEGYFVLCDQTTMTQSDIDNGQLICEVGVATVKPSEFVVFHIGLRIRAVQVSAFASKSASS